MRTLKVSVLASAFALVALADAAAYAQDEPSSADMASARALGQEGVKLADAGNCPEAVEKLSRAERIFHAPTTLARLGECQVQMGRLVDGTENLNKVVRETLASSAPPAFRQAQERAAKILGEARPKIAKLKIAVAGPQDVAWTVKVDGEAIPLANLNMNRPIDPGEHVVDATAPGYKVARAKVNLPEAGTDSVALTLEPDPNAPKVVATVAPSSLSPTSSGAESAARTEAAIAPNRVPAYIAIGVGVAGLGVGGILGLMATSKKNDLDSACPDKLCPADQQDNIDTGKSMATISTVGFVVGAVGLVVGGYLYLTAGPSKSGARAAKRISPHIGIGHVGLVF